MDEPEDGLDELASTVDRMVRECRALSPSLEHQDALRLVQAVDAAITAADHARRRYSSAAHEQARRAVARAHSLLAEARSKPGTG